MEQSAEKRDLAQRIKHQLLDCVGWDNDELAESRKDAYKYYFQRPRGDEIAGRSSVISADLSSMVEGILSQMADALTGKRVAEFTSVDASDEEQAQLESDCVTEMLFGKQAGFIEVVTAIKDAALLRNCVAKVYVDKRTYSKRIRRTSVKPEVLMMVMENAGGELITHSYDPETEVLSATIKKHTKKFCFETIAPENFMRPKNWHRQDLEGIPFCAERHLDTRATLIELGFDRAIVDLLPMTKDTGNTTQNARRPRSVGVAIGQVLDKSQETVEWFECYARTEAADGTGELRRICMSGAYILADDPEDIIPYGCGLLILNPHTWIGVSLYDKLKGVQDMGTAMQRALMDNLSATNKNRTAHLDGVVENTDLTDGRHNNSVRVDPDRVQDVRQAIMAFQVPDTSGNILLNLQNLKTMRSELGGASLDLSTGNVQMSDRLGSQGLDRAYSVMESLASLMTKLFAHTLIRSVYLVAHEIIRTQWNEEIKFKRGKEWVQTHPSKWQVRDSVHVNLGQSLGERTRLAAVYKQLLGIQAELAGAGMEGIMIGAENYFRALMEWLRVSDVPVPELYAIDPRTPASKQEMIRKQRAAQTDTAERKGLMAGAISLEQLRVAMEKYRVDTETTFKYWQECLNAQIEEAKLATSAVVDISKARNDAGRANDKAGKGNGSVAAKEQSAIGGDSKGSE